MKHSHKINISLNRSTNISVYGLNLNEINELRKIALAKYGKANISLLVRHLLKEHIQQPTINYQEDNIMDDHLENKRLTLRVPPKYYAYITQKAELQHSSLNEVVRDILIEYITKNPVLTNDEVQALYQSNYQLLLIGRNINQIAKSLNSFMPESLTTKQLNALSCFLTEHTEKVGKILGKKGKSFKYRKERKLPEMV